ncbi:MAG: hypothetical protein DPW16_14130 [Chloroflexi bacterium]|nr:hypothetical protein [Chloroflexota bacterium]
MTVQRIVAPVANPRPTKTTINQGVVPARLVLGAAEEMIETKKTTNRVIPASVVLAFPVVVDVMNLWVAHVVRPVQAVVVVPPMKGVHVVLGRPVLGVVGMIKTKKTTKTRTLVHAPVLVVSAVLEMRKKMISRGIGPVHQEGVRVLAAVTDPGGVVRRLVVTGMPIVDARAEIGPEHRHKTRAAQAHLARPVMARGVEAHPVAVHLVAAVVPHSTVTGIRMKKMRAAQVAVLAAVVRRLAETGMLIAVVVRVGVHHLVEIEMRTAAEAAVV